MGCGSLISIFEKGDPQGVPLFPFCSASDDTKIYHNLRRQYYWSGIKKNIGDFIHRCLTCQHVKAEHQRPARLLQPLKLAEWKLEYITMDFVTHLPRTSRGHGAVWMIVDRLTMSAHCLAMRMTFTLEEFYRLYIRDCPVA